MHALVESCPEIKLHNGFDGDQKSDGNLPEGMEAEVWQQDAEDAEAAKAAEEVRDTYFPKYLVYLSIHYVC